MALKNFRPALADCQAAYALQAPTASQSNPNGPSPSGSSAPATPGGVEVATPQAQAKTLTRLARCHFALGAPNPALSTLRTALALDPPPPRATAKSPLSPGESRALLPFFILFGHCDLCLRYLLFGSLILLFETLLSYLMDIYYSALYSLYPVP